jgi:hypothetical protein
MLAGVDEESVVIGLGFQACVKEEQRNRQRD